MRNLPILALLATLGACLSLLKQPKAPEIDRSFGSYVYALRWEGFENKHDQSPSNDVIGEIARSLKPRTHDLASRASTAHGMAGVSLVFDGVADDHICFVNSAHSSKPASADDLAARYALWVEAHDALEPLASRPLLPSPGNKLESIEEISNERKINSRGDWVHWVTWRQCGTAPTLTAQTGFVAVVVHREQPGGASLPETPENVGLLLWELGP